MTISLNKTIYRMKVS